MKLDHHEEVFKKTLQQQHVPLDTGRLWDQIEPHIDSEDQDRKPIFWWWIFGGLSSLAIIAAAIFIFNDRYTISIDEKPNAAAKPEVVASNLNSPKTINTKEIKSTTIPVVNSESILKSKTKLNKNDEPKSKNKPANNKTSIKKSTLTNISDNDFVLSASLDEHSASSIEANSQAISDGILNQEESEINVEKIDDENQGSNAILPTYIAPIETIERERHTTRTKQVVAKLEHDVDVRLPIAKIDLLPNIKNIATLAMPQDDLVFSPIIVKNRNKSNWNVFAELGMGNYSTNSGIGANSDMERGSQLNDVSTRTRHQNASLGISFNISKSFSVQTGLSYTRFQDQTRLNNVVELTSAANGISDIYYVNDTSAGDYVNIVPPYESANLIESPIKKNLYHHYIDVPIRVLYQRRMRKFTLGGSLGVLVNVDARTSGVYLDQSNSFGALQLDAKSKNNGQSSDGLKINYMGSVQVGYQITPALQIYLKPSARYIRNFPNNQNGGTNNILASGLNLGVQMRIK